MRIRLARVGRKAPRWADDGVEHYVRRLRRWVRWEEVALKPAVFRGDVDAVRAQEGDRIRGLIQPGDHLVALDERGEGLTSEAFAAMVDEGLVSGGMIFALGGPYGHDPSVRDAAWRTVRLAPMVLNHQVARLVVVEQIYRSLTLREGVPYHH